MRKRLKKVESHIKPFNDVLNALGKFNKGEIIGVCGAPGIGKTIFARFLAHVISLESQVLYSSFYKNQFELARILYLTNRDRIYSEKDSFSLGKEVNANNTYSYSQDESLKNLFYESFWDPETLNSFYGCSIDISYEHSRRGLHIGDVKFSKYPFDLLLQIETMLNTASDNHEFEVLFIDDIDLYPAKVKEFEEWDYTQFFQALKSLNLRYNLLIVIVSNIRFSRVKSEYISIESLSYVEGGSSFMEVCDKVIFADRPGYYEIDLENRNEDKDIYNVFLVKKSDEVIERASEIKCSRDFKYLQYKASGFFEVLNFFTVFGMNLFLKNI